MARRVRRPRGSTRVLGLRVYRAAVLIGIFAGIYSMLQAERTRTDRPITLREVRQHAPAASRLTRDARHPGSWQILAEDDALLGRALRTSPLADDVIGYAGPTDTLVILDGQDRIEILALRRSEDTPGHVADVVADAAFWSQWTGRAVDEVVEESLRFDAVSGASKTSRGILRGVQRRLALEARGDDDVSQGLSWTAWDIVLVALAIVGGVLRWLERRLGRWARWVYRALSFLVLAMITGDVLALSLFGAWAENGLPWRETLGVVVLAASALLWPLWTGRSVYCSDVCPLGIAQDAAGHVHRRLGWIPRWQLRPESGLGWMLGMLPGFLLVTAGIAVCLALSLDLANLEAFDVVAWPNARAIAVGLAVVGVAASLFVPKAYCRFGCPTGSLLELVRTPHRGARLRWRDGVATLFLILVWTLGEQRALLESWLREGPW